MSDPQSPPITQDAIDMIDDPTIFGPATPEPAEPLWLTLTCWAALVVLGAFSILIWRS